MLLRGAPFKKCPVYLNMEKELSQIIRTSTYSPPSPHPPFGNFSSTQTNSKKVFSWWRWSRCFRSGWHWGSLAEHLAKVGTDGGCSCTLHSQVAPCFSIYKEDAYNMQHIIFNIQHHHQQVAPPMSVLRFIKLWPWECNVWYYCMFITSL